jgi:hypothetical protein
MRLKLLATGSGTKSFNAEKLIRFVARTATNFIRVSLDPCIF